jgi:hypothetical protein
MVTIAEENWRKDGSTEDGGCEKTKGIPSSSSSDSGEIYCHI